MKTEQEIFHAAEIGLEHIEQLLRENREITCLYPEKNSYYFIELPASGWESNAVCHEIVMSVKIDAVLESFLRNDCIVIVKKPLKDQKTMKKIAQLYRITVRANKDSLAEAQFIQTVYATATDEESSCESSNQRLIELGRVSWREV